MAKGSMRSRARAIAWMLTLVYFASYFTRINFNVMMVKICSDLGVAKSEIAIVVTALTISYGIGQVVNGLLGDKIKPQWMLTGGLALAISSNVAMFFAKPILPMAVIWCINGFAHSMLWPPIVRLMSTYLTDDEYSYAAVRVSWGSSFATITLYLLCPVLLNVLTWRQIILVCAAVGLLILVVWQIMQGRLFTQPIALADKKKLGTMTGAPKLPRYVFFALPMIMLGIILQGALRDGVTDWMPSVMNESLGISEEDAILTAVIPAVFSVVSFMAFDLIHRKLLRNEVTCAAVIFLGSAISSLVLVFASMWWSSAVLSVLLMAIIIACMHGINLMLITVVPKRFVKTGKVSTVSGILNACTYVGASIAIPVFAVLEEIFDGWTAAFVAWLVISLLGMTVCLVVSPIWKKFRKEYADTPIEESMEQNS